MRLVWMLLFGVIGADFKLNGSAPDVQAPQAAKPSIQSPYVITFFIRPFTEIQRIAERYASIKKLIETPGTLNRLLLAQYDGIPGYRGIYATYAGYVDHTNGDGQIILPLKQLKKELTVIVVDHLYPVILSGLTVNHFEVESPEKAAYYQYEQTHNEDIGALVWRVRRLERPSSNRIPLGSLVIFARPQDILILEGDYITQESPNFVLPDLYALPDAATSEQALRLLTVNYFMEPVGEHIKREANRVMLIV